MDSIISGSKDSAIVTPRLLSGIPSLQCGMSTKRGGATDTPFPMNMSLRIGDDEERVRGNRRRFFQQVGFTPAQAAYPRQVHGSLVRCVDQPGTYDDCDGLISNDRGLLLAISVADCAPILLFDVKKFVIGAVHAGWRGSQLGIVVNAIQLMRSRFDSLPEDILAYIGPSAGVCCYEVREEVAALFPPEVVERKPHVAPHLDVKGHNLRLLQSQGVPEANIEVAGECTICCAELFHSFRRDREQSGRMLAVIGQPEKQH